MAHEELMTNEELIELFMRQVVIADKHTVGDYMASIGRWSEGVSAVNNSYKWLNTLVDAGKLVRGDGFYRLPDCKSEYADHARALTKALAEILKLNLDTHILREHTIAEKGLRPDALVLLTKEGRGLCFVLEVCVNEREDYLNQKINTWFLWDGANQYLSQLFGKRIKHFEIVTVGLDTERTFNFNQYLQEVKNGI